MASYKGRSGKNVSGMEGLVERGLCLCTVEKTGLKNSVTEEPY